MKDKILNLRNEGKSYRQIQIILGCSRSTISYHCGVGQIDKKKSDNRNYAKLKSIRLSEQICLKCESPISINNSKFCSSLCANSFRKKPETEKQKVKRLMNEYYNLKFSAFTGTERFKKIREDRLMAANFDDLKYEGRRDRVILEQNNSCGNCRLSEWYGNQLSLEVDHIDGDNTNNNRTNLIALCPNCHSITPTWRGRNCRRDLSIKLTPVDYVQAFKETGNVRQALLSLGLAGKGGNYKMMYKYLDSYNVSY